MGEKSRKIREIVHKIQHSTNRDSREREETANEGKEFI